MTIEDEARAAAEKRFPDIEADAPGTPLAQAKFPTGWSRESEREAYVEGYKDGASRPTGETFDEDTLRKVYDALWEAGLNARQVANAVNQMQNAGILFRERTPEPAHENEGDS